MKSSPTFAITLVEKQKAAIVSSENCIALNRLETIFCLQQRQQHILYE